MNVVLVCVDNFQEYILINIKQLIRLKHKNIFIITNTRFFDLFREFKEQIVLVSSENLDDYYNYKPGKNIDNSFRNGFWGLTSKRFFFIHSFMKQRNIEKVFHIENDVLTYYNENMIDKEQIKKRVERNRWFEESLPQTAKVQMSKNVNNCIEEFKRRNVGGQICKYSEIQSNNHASGSKIYDDDDVDDENNTYIYCNPSSKLLFDDLRKVHKNESVFNIDVMSNEQEPLYKNCDDLRL